jgi:hypothetical protein
MFHSKDDIQKLRLFYMNNPPDGMTKNVIKNMPDNDLLDMDCFLNEDTRDIFKSNDEN